MNCIGFDFSINKPAATVYSNNTYIFFAWPWGFDEKLKSIYRENGVFIVDRKDDKDKGPDISSKLRYEVNNSRYLSTLIIDTLKPYLNKDTFIAFEGLSYGSSGDVVLQLGGYKYILMDRLSDIVPMENMFTYSPITIKKTSKCSKKGKTKKDMIEAFVNTNIHSRFRESLENKREIFLNKNGKNFIAGVDDLVDSFWTLETLQNKESLTVS